MVWSGLVSHMNQVRESGLVIRSGCWDCRKNKINWEIIYGINIF